jgi:hypothetical protein
MCHPSGIAENEKDRVLTKFNNGWDRERYYDSQLSQLWKDARARAESQPESASNVVLKAILDNLEESIKPVVDMWFRRNRKPEGIEKGGSEIDNNRFATVVESVWDDLCQIRPIEVDHYIYYQFIQESKHQFSYWTALRASCVYNKYYRSIIPWYIAGFDLCKSKAKASGMIRVMTSEMYNILKVDSKLADRMSGIEEDENEENDEFPIEDDGP